MKYWIIVFVLVIIAGLFLNWGNLGTILGFSINLNYQDTLEIYVMGDTIPGTKIYSWTAPASEPPGSPAYPGTQTVKLDGISCNPSGDCSAIISASFYTGSQTPHFQSYETNYVYYTINGVWINSIGFGNPNFEIVDGQLQEIGSEPEPTPPPEPPPQETSPLFLIIAVVLVSVFVGIILLILKGGNLIGQMKGQAWLIVLVLLLIFLIVWLVLNWVSVDFEAIQGFFTGLLNQTQVGGG